MGYVSTFLLLFGAVLAVADDGHLPEFLTNWPVYGVFIIPGIIGITMLLLTDREVSGIHKRFDDVAEKLDRIDSKLDKLDSIDATLKEIAECLRRP